MGGHKPGSAVEALRRLKLPAMRGARRESPRASLKLQLFLVLAIALSPVIVLSSLNAIRGYIDAKHQARTNLNNIAAGVTDEVARYLTNAFQVLTILRAQPELHEQSERTCKKFLAATLEGFDGFANIFLVDGAGNVTCSAVPIEEKFNSSNSYWWHQLKSHQGPIVGTPETDEITGEKVVIAALPFGRDQSHPDGAIAVALRNTVLQRLRRFANIRSNTLLFVLNNSGNVILGPTDTASLADLPADGKLLASVTAKGEVVDAPARSGAPFVYAIVPMLGGRVWGVVAQAAYRIDAPRALNMAWQVLIPILIVAGVLAIVWLGTDTIVLRWIRYLTAVATAYRRGRMDVRAQKLEHAPREIRQLGLTMGRMAAAISDREIRLKQTIEQRETLIREVHHRVRNNLQVISSLINLQVRSTSSAEAVDAMARVQKRVEALLLVYREVYLANHVERVDFRSLVPRIVAHTVEYVGAHAPNVTVCADSDPMWPRVDQALSLCQLIVESVSHACRHSFPDGRPGKIAVSLRRRSSEDAELTIEDDGVGSPAQMQSAFPGGQLLQAFIKSLVRQLAGTIEIFYDRGTKVVVRFPYREADILILPSETAAAPESRKSETVARKAPKTEPVLLSRLAGALDL